MKKSVRFLSIVSVLTLLLTFCGCGAENAQINWYNFQAEYSWHYSGEVASNQNYTLLWDEETACVTLKDNETGETYGNIPQNAEDYTSHPQVFSPINVGYIESDTLNTSTSVAKLASIKEGALYSEEIENGIKVTYYFEDISVSVPVSYILREDSLLVTVDPNEIGEDETICYDITLMPFFCSVNNTASKDNYLFVPSGSGTLIYPKVLGDGITSVISNRMYGPDAQSGGNSDRVTENINLPVYGAKCGDSAVCAIIENSAETAELTTNVGSSTYGFSAVYPSFYIRGSQLSTATYMSGFNSQKTLFCEGKVEEKIEIGFYPLKGEDANYSGMAKTYREYLVEKENLTKKENDTLLNTRIIGGVLEKKYFLGVPYNGLTVLTDFEEANSISKELLGFTDGNVNVNLYGFGKQGADIGKPAGGAGYSSKFGSIKKLENNDRLSYYFNFDLLRFSDSGLGINKLFGIARTAIGGRNKHRYANVYYSTADWTSKVHYYIKRSELGGLADKVNKKVSKWDIEGVSLDTLTSLSYSDYYESKYYAKSGFGKQTAEIMDKFADNGLKLAATRANAYAAVKADVVYDIPTCSSKYQVYDCDIPFYGMVFKGYIPVTGDAINLSANSTTAFLNSVECGLGLNYTLMANYDKALFDAKQNIYYSSVYSDVKEDIKTNIADYKELFESVKNTAIDKHSIEPSGLHKTVFENGVTVYTNYSNSDITAEGITVKANGFIAKVGG